MAAEVTLKEESALEIGKSLANSFQGLQAVGADTATGGLELEEEREQTSYLEKISGGIKKMVVFFGGLAASIKEANRDRLITEAQGTEEEKEELASDPERSLNLGAMFKSVGEKTKAFAGGITGIFGGLFGKAALFGLLLTFALNMDKFSGQIKEFVGPIFEGLKSAFKSLKEDVFPILTNILGFFGEAFTGIQNLLKGLFTGDGSAFLSGIKTILIDLPLRLVSIIGDAFFSLVDAVLNFFGIESQMVQDIKMAFRTFPEAVKNAVNAFVDFFVVDIPNKFNELKTAATDKFTSLVTGVKDAVTGFADSVINTILDTVQKVKDFIMAPIKAIKEKVSGVFTSVTDFFTGGDEESKATAKAMTGENKRDTLLTMRDNLLVEGPVSDSEQAKNNFLKKLRSLNDALIKEDGLGEEHIRANKIDPYNYAVAHTEGTDTSFVNQILKPENNNTEVLNENSNMPMIEPSELQNNGGQLNKDSQEFASAPPSVNMNMIKGGDNNNISSNQTHTNIAESTTTSDINAKKIFKTA